MRTNTLTLVATLLITGLALAASSDDATVAEVAQLRALPAGAPHASDVCFSSRWRRTASDESPYDTLRDAAAFHATRLDWHYSTDKAWLRQARAHGLHVGGALNTILTDRMGATTHEEGRLHDAEGNKVTAPWMRVWDRTFWGCVNSPEYRRTWLEHARNYLDAGVDVLHMDDPMSNLGGVRWGACFCEYCRRRAEQQGVDLHDAAAMETFQHDSVAAFFADVRGEIDRYAGRHVPMSSNNFRARWTFPYNLFDYGIAEYHDPNPAEMVRLMRDVQAQHRAQVITLREEDAHSNRQTIALTYALGLHMIAPYDVYLESTPEGSRRLFLEPAQVADLYGFARARAHLLDGYSDAACIGADLDEDRYGATPPVLLDPADAHLYAFVRARAGQPTAPAVVHLVNWNGPDTPVTVQLRPERFCRNGKVAFSLHLPAPYDADTHARAEQSGDYAPLAQVVPVPVQRHGDLLAVTVPAPQPWSMLVVTAADQASEPVAGAAQLAQPRVLTPGTPRYADVCMSSRWPRPLRENDPYDTFEALRAFHATRLEWIYCKDKAFYDRLKPLGIPAAAAASGHLAQDDPDAQMRNLHGEHVTAPWMMHPGWDMWQGCSNRPAYRQILLDHFTACLAAGAENLHVDGICVNEAYMRYGACYCDVCIPKFQAYLAEHADPQRWAALQLGAPADFNYRQYGLDHGEAPPYVQELWQDFLLASDIECIHWLREEIDHFAGRHVLFATNNGSFQTWNRKLVNYDYGFGELMESTANVLHLCDSARRCIALGKMQTINMPKYKGDPPREQIIALARRVIGTVNGLGMPAAVPWDTWIQGNERFFGTPEEFAHFFRFMREQADRLNGYELVCSAGYQGDPGRFVPTEPVVEHAPVLVHADDVFAFVRARPGQHAAPVVVHLIDWRDAPAAFDLTLNPLRFFGARRVELTLLQPDRAPVRLTPSHGPDGNQFRVPSLAPWGMLVVAAAPDVAATRPVPLLVAPVVPQVDNRTGVTLLASDPAAEIRYTLDGAEPVRTSARYVEPIRLNGPRTVKARCFLPDGTAGAVVAYPFKYTTNHVVNENDVPPQPDVFLDELEPRDRIHGGQNSPWDGRESINASLLGGPLRIAGRTYSRGIGVHSHSELVYDIKPEYTAFVAVMGIDDNAGPHASVDFHIFVDDKALYETPKLYRHDPTARLAEAMGEYGPGGRDPGRPLRYIHLELPAGARRLRLVMGGAGDSVRDDVGAWARAGFLRQPQR